VKSRTLSISISAPPAAVYAFAVDPMNLPKWAAGLCRSVERIAGKWLLLTSAGPMSFEYVARNALGVLDHTVTLPSGVKVLNAMRVVANDAGSEVLFTLFQRPGISDATFAADAALIEKDLSTLKKAVERLSSRAR
jgi:hypothetical protein